MIHTMSRSRNRDPETLAHPERARASSGPQPKALGDLRLDAEDLQALTELARATTASDAQKQAARVRALLGSETARLAELLDALVERTRHLQKVERLAGTDELTGLANRRAFNESLRRELSRTGRGKAPLSLLLFDVDGLKAINDNLGHRGGDAALQTVASCLRHGTRAGDFAARIGGDEFAVILPATEPEAAQVIGERIRAMVGRLGCAGRPLGVSLGSAISRGGEPDATALISAADLALYRDKAARKAERAAQVGRAIRRAAH
jgi:diguanylate cyclase (GGDEF)-like protein